MSGVAEFVRGPLSAEERAASKAEVTTSRPVPPGTSIYDEQILVLVQQLFLQEEQPQYRHVGFTAADLQRDVAPICLNVATRLGEQGQHDIGLIDAGVDGSPLERRIGKSRPSEGTWEIRSKLWLVPREEWLKGDARSAISTESLLRLQQLSTQFDFSILCCDPMSSLPARIGRACDGLVLVLTANQTRRLVARSMHEQLRAAQVPLLGTVLAERRFPVPNALYRRL